jgi:hypothetical protein
MTNETPETGTNDTGKYFIMPAISVIVPQTGLASRGALTYDLGQGVRRNKWSIFTSISSAVIAFFAAVILFAIPVALTSLLLVQTMSSQGFLTIKTQDVPHSQVYQYTPAAPGAVIPAK